MYATTRHSSLVFFATSLLLLTGLSPALAEEGGSASPRRHRRPQDLKAILGDRIAGTLGRDDLAEALPPRASVTTPTATAVNDANRRNASSRKRAAPGNATGGQGGASRGTAGALADAFGIDYQPTARAGNRSQGGGSSSATSAASGSPAAAKAPSAASGEDSAEAARRRDIAAREARRRAQAVMEARKSEAIRKTLQHVRMAENRERSMIRLAERNRQDSGWFGGLNRFVTGSDPYQIDIDNARQKLNLLQMTRRELQGARRAPDWQTQIDKLNIGRRRLGMREIDPRTGLESDQAPRPSSINSVDTDRERYQVEQEAISVTQRVVVDVGSAAIPIGALGNGARLAGQGVKAGLRRGTGAAVSKLGRAATAANRARTAATAANRARTAGNAANRARTAGNAANRARTAGNAANQALSGGAARVAKHGHLWQRAPLDKAIARHAGSNATSWISKTGKTIFENPATGRQVVVDAAGYFRIFQPNTIGGAKGVYLNMLGKVPAPARHLKGGAIKNVPLQGADLQRWTHFLIQ